MATINRSTVVRGPAVIIHDTITYYTEGDVTVNVSKKKFKINSSFGELGSRLDDIEIKISFKPVGVWTAALVLKSHPYFGTTQGASIYTGTDKTCVVHGIEGEKLTFAASAITKLSDLWFSATKTLFDGTMEITCIGKNNTAWDNAGKRVVQAAAAFPSHTLDKTKILTRNCSAAWNSLTFANTVDGFKASFDLKLNPETEDGEGIYDYTFESIAAKVTFTPVGKTMTETLTALNIQDTGVLRGAEDPATSDLTITGTGIYAAFYEMALDESSLMWGASAKRIGQLSFSSTRRFTAGALDPVALLDVSAPI